jgi:hypothetical protein
MPENLGRIKASPDLPISPSWVIGKKKHVCRLKPGSSHAALVKKLENHEIF